MKAPCNSEDSEVDKPIVGSEDSEEEEVKVQFEEADDGEEKRATFDKNIL